MSRAGPANGKFFVYFILQGVDQNWVCFMSIKNVRTDQFTKVVQSSLIEYADQSTVEIEWYSDTVTIGNTTVANVTIGAAVRDTIRPGPTTPFFDGIFGLAFPYLNDHEIQPVGL